MSNETKTGRRAFLAHFAGAVAAVVVAVTGDWILSAWLWSSVEAMKLVGFAAIAGYLVAHGFVARPVQ